MLVFLRACQELLDAKMTKWGHLSVIFVEDRESVDDTAMSLRVDFLVDGKHSCP
jgi:hypothetical protein